MDWLTVLESYDVWTSVHAVHELITALLASRRCSTPCWDTGLGRATTSVDNTFSTVATAPIALGLMIGMAAVLLVMQGQRLRKVLQPSQTIRPARSQKKRLWASKAKEDQFGFEEAEVDKIGDVSHDEFGQNCLWVSLATEEHRNADTPAQAPDVEQPRPRDDSCLGK